MYVYHVYINFCVLTSILNSISRSPRKKHDATKEILDCIVPCFHRIFQPFFRLCQDTYRRYKCRGLENNGCSNFIVQNCLNRAACAQLQHTLSWNMSMETAFRFIFRSRFYHENSVVYLELCHIAGQFLSRRMTFANNERRKLRKTAGGFSTSQNMLSGEFNRITAI